MRGSKTRRRPPGFGSIEKLASGKIRAAAMIEGRRTKGPAIDPSRFPSRSAAEREALTLLQRKLDERNAGPRSSFTTFARAWLMRKRDQRLSPSTIAVWQSWLNSLATDPLGDLCVSDVAPADLRAWTGRFRGATVTLRKRLSWLMQLLDEAGNPARIDLPRKEKSRRRPLTPPERAVLREAFASADDELQLMILLTWEAHLRRSEAAGLRHEDRDGDGVWIQRVVLAVDGKLIVRDKAKTVRSHGWVALSPALRERIGHGTGFVLGNGKRPVSPRRITNRIQHFARSLNVPKMGPHALRRTGGMEMLENLVDLKTAASQMRHDWKMLMDEYTETRQDQKVAAIEKTYGTGA